MSRIVVFLLCAAPMWAQALKLTSVQDKAGTAASVMVVLTSPAGKEPLALQWDLFYTEAVEIAVADMAAASSAESAGKSLTCAARPRTGKESVVRCLVVGGQKRISNGPVAVMKIQLNAKASARSATIRLDQAQAVSIDMKGVTIAPAQLEVPVRK